MPKDGTVHELTSNVSSSTHVYLCFSYVTMVDICSLAALQTQPPPYRPQALCLPVLWTQEDSLATGDSTEWTILVKGIK